MKDMLKCPVCGEVLTMEIGYTGADWNCMAGEGSGYGYELSLICKREGCGRVYTLGHLKAINGLSEVIDRYKSTK